MKKFILTIATIAALATTAAVPAEARGFGGLGHGFGHGLGHGGFRHFGHGRFGGGLGALGAVAAVGLAAGAIAAATDNDCCYGGNYGYRRFGW
jgi:hypothetical protein